MPAQEKDCYCQKITRKTIKPSIALTFHIVQTNIMTVGDDSQDFLFERGEVVRHTATEESEKGGYA